MAHSITVSRSNPSPAWPAHSDFHRCKRNSLLVLLQHGNECEGSTLESIEPGGRNCANGVRSAQSVAIFILRRISRRPGVILHGLWQPLSAREASGEKSAESHGSRIVRQGRSFKLPSSIESRRNLAKALGQCLFPIRSARLRRRWTRSARSGDARPVDGHDAWRQSVR